MALKISARQSFLGKLMVLVRIPIPPTLNPGRTQTLGANTEPELHQRECHRICPSEFADIGSAYWAPSWVSKFRRSLPSGTFFAGR